MTGSELMSRAIEARENSYSPYSGFCVGAALLCADGRVFCGCNIENAAYSETVCAERVAVFKAISEGAREFSAIAIAGGEKNGLADCTPCGACRQVLFEHCGKDLTVIVKRGDGIEEYKLGALLPSAFGL